MPDLPRRPAGGGELWFPPEPSKPVIRKKGATSLEQQLALHYQSPPSLEDRLAGRAPLIDPEAPPRPPTSLEAQLALFHEKRSTKLLVVTYEYDCFSFSGNGVYAQSLVRGLKKQPGVHVTVACAGPYGAPEHCEPPTTADVVVALERWGTLDMASGHQQFTRKMMPALEQHFETHPWPDLILCIDWHAGPTCMRLRDKRPAAIAYFSFRVFSKGPGSREFYKAREFACTDAAWITFALSESDATFLRELCPPQKDNIRVLLPPLRKDLEERGREDRREPRVFLSCVVRLSEEKEPERFIRLVEALAKRGAFDGKNGFPEGLQPVLVTARIEVDNQTPMVQRFLATHPTAEAFPFQTADGLAELYSHTRLLVHPPKYDAFGMVVVEAAAFGAPTIFQQGADVGSKVVLSFGPDPGAFFEADLDDDRYVPPEARPPVSFDGMTREEIREYHAKWEDGISDVCALLKDDERLAKTARLARERAMHWNEEAHGGFLMTELRPVIDEARECIAEVDEYERRQARIEAQARANGTWVEPKPDVLDTASEEKDPDYDDLGRCVRPKPKPRKRRLRGCWCTARLARRGFTDEELYLRDSESDNESIPDLTEAEAKELYDNIRWI